MRQKDTPANNLTTLGKQKHRHPVATLTAHHRAIHTDYFELRRIKHSTDQIEIIASTKGQTGHSATLVFGSTSRAHARKLLEILTEKEPSARPKNDPVPATTIAAEAMTYASIHNITVATPERRSGHDSLSRFFDEEIMRFSMREIQRMFRVEGLGGGIYHLSFPNQALMNSCFMRLQEHFESPKFRGKTFGNDEFRAWYRTTRDHKEFSYYTDWSGFNIPGYVLTLFLNGRFDPLQPGEQAVVETFRSMRGSLYIIGTLENDTISTLRHELAHALYHTNPYYRNAVDTLLEGVNCTPIHRMLKALGYHRAQWRDEAHAYLGDDPWELEVHGINTAFYTHVRQELLRLYNKYSPVLHKG